ncbi:MAG: hypothetical protein KDH20_13305 [Rhodocyclaceae bacterium]|nr:hypothetical protein [Rhodocyclaceae bacterium]
MDCPACQRPTITFRQWCRSPNALRWTCPHCHAVLKANRRTWICFAAAVGAVCTVVVVISMLEQRGWLEPGRNRGWVWASALLVALPISLLAYRLGGYTWPDNPR